MKKDFQKWHSKKEKINDIEKPPFFHEREIWFCHLGANVGFEQDGAGNDFLRPVLVIRKFNNDVFWAVPLTKPKNKVSHKKESYYYAFFFGPGVKSIAILSQIRMIDSRRLSYRMGEINEQDFLRLIEKLKALLP